MSRLVDSLSLIEDDPLSRREKDVGPVVMPDANVVTVVEGLVFSLHFLLRLLVISLLSRYRPTHVLICQWNSRGIDDCQVLKY